MLRPYVAGRGHLGLQADRRCCCYYQRHQPHRGHRDQADHEHAHVLRLHQGQGLGAVSGRQRPHAQEVSQATHRLLHAADSASTGTEGERRDEEVEKAWKDACKSAGGAKAFKKTLKTYGYTEDTYKDSLKESLAQQKLKDAVAPTSKPKDSEIVDYINENLSSYNDARRSSNILIKVDSDASDEDKAAAKAKAQECLDKINSGELSFEDAVEQYSEDTGSKEKKGDVGWDKLTTFVDSYQTALEGLNKGDVSEVIESTYGYHIIKCTDYFHVDNQVDDINQVPKAIKKYVSNVVKTQAASTAYSEWLEQYKKDADITVNPMPKDVPYNVSLKGITKSSTDDSSTTE